MYLVVNSGRIIQKINTVLTSPPFTVAPSNDHLDGSWSNSDLYDGEFGINSAGPYLCVRISGAIYYVPLSTSAVSPSAGYKIYRALLSQAGGSAPTATILENTLGEVPTFTYDSTGKYKMQSAGSLFIAGKTWWMIGNAQEDVADAAYFFYAKPTSSSEFIIISRELSLGGPSFNGIDSALVNIPFEILIYP